MENKNQGAGKSMHKDNAQDGKNMNDKNTQQHGAKPQDGKSNRGNHSNDSKHQDKHKK